MSYQRARLGFQVKLPRHVRLIYCYMIPVYLWESVSDSVRPFLVDYLVEEPKIQPLDVCCEEKGIASEQVYQQVLDLFVYSRLPFLMIAGRCLRLPVLQGRLLRGVGVLRMCYACNGVLHVARDASDAR